MPVEQTLRNWRSFVRISLIVSFDKSVRSVSARRETFDSLLISSVRQSTVGGRFHRGIRLSDELVVIQGIPSYRKNRLHDSKTVVFEGYPDRSLVVKQKFLMVIF